MKREKAKRRFLIFLISLAIIAVDIYLFVYLSGDSEKGKVVNKEKIEIPINQKISNSMSSFEQTKNFDRTIDYFLKKWEIKGASFALMKDDKLVYAKGYGVADAISNERCEVRHLFRVASVSKLITAVTIMKLREEGKIKLSDKVFGEGGVLNDSIFTSMIRYKQTRNITVEHLLRHQAGFSKRAGDPMFNMEIMASNLKIPLPLTMDDIVRYAAQSPLSFQPGGSSSYSNLGYLVLSKIVEKVSGIEYETYVRDSILAPIGCYDMHLGENYQNMRRDNEVNYYGVWDEEPVEAYDGTGRIVAKSDGGNDIKGLYGAGAWIASPVELLKFVAAVDDANINNNFLSRESVNLMTQFSSRELPIGWAKVTSNDEWLRSGTFSGTSALIKHQRNNMTWVFITNTSSWKGAYFTSYINSAVTSAIKKVDDWPIRDLFVDIPEDLSIYDINIASSNEDEDVGNNS